MKTVLITGCSSGYGLETARYFHSKGWNVIATMRTPREDILPQSDRLRARPNRRRLVIPRGVEPLYCRYAREAVSKPTG
jgi:NAD(P)-dependent dehydrogenase (short-subunit alcohol dehydrogenase family)